MENKRLNIIPGGRQLHRTPPSKNSNKSQHQPQPQSHSPAPEPAIKQEEDAETRNGPNVVPHSPVVKEERDSVQTPTNITASATKACIDPDTFIRGMQGYQWTDADLEFVYQARQKKQVQQLEGELAEVRKVLKTETQRLELAQAAQARLESELSKIPSCELVMELCRSVLTLYRPSVQLQDDDDDSTLVSKLRVEDVWRAVKEESSRLERLHREVNRAQQRRHEEEQIEREIENQQKKNDAAKKNIDALRVELAQLKLQQKDKEESSQAAAPRGKAQKTAKTASNAAKAQKNKTLKVQMTKKTSSIKTDDPEAASDLRLSKTELTKETPKAARRPRNKPKASKPAEASSVESESGTLRRSKRIASKAQNLAASRGK